MVDASNHLDEGDKTNEQTTDAIQDEQRAPSTEEKSRKEEAPIDLDKIRQELARSFQKVVDKFPHSPPLPDRKSVV